MKKNLLIKITSTCILVLFLCFIGKNTYAVTSDFSVTPNIPENQLEESQGFFNLLMDPGAEQDISIVLSNDSSNPITIDVGFARATTNGNGISVYDSSKENKKDDSLIYNIEDFVEPSSKEITIPANSQTIFSSKVKMPENKFDGVLAGGFSFKNKVKGSPDSSEGVAINNEYKYVIALIIQQNVKEVSPLLSLNEVSVSQRNYRNIISANLQNSASTYLKDMVVTTTVQGISNPENKYIYNDYGMKMAPNSNFDLAIPISTGKIDKQNSKKLEPGKYHLSMTIYGKKSKNGAYQISQNNEMISYQHMWTFEKDFEISAEKADKLNRDDPTVEYKPHINWLLIIILTISILILVLILLNRVYKKNKH